METYTIVYRRTADTKKGVKRNLRAEVLALSTADAVDEFGARFPAMVDGVAWLRVYRGRV